MAAETDKENIAAGLEISRPEFDTSATTTKKSSKKSRSKSIGPTATALTTPTLKEDAGNRRKSLAASAVKSILSKEDEVKRKEARRKSLAARRVSFAPEATLHTWDVIVEMRDQTSSSSGSSKRSSPRKSPRSAARDEETTDLPATPTEELGQTEPRASPGDHNEKHNKKHRRRHSGMSTVDFDDPDDVFTTSPQSELQPQHVDDEDTAMSLCDDNEENYTSKSSATEHSTSSSAKLDAALKEAAMHAGTHRIDFDEDGDMSMEMATQDVTAAFKPWVQSVEGGSRSRGAPSNMPLPTDDQENVNPFASAYRRNSTQQNDAEAEYDEVTEVNDMSMDITRAVGGIVAQSAVGTIGDKTPTTQTQIGPRSSLKRRRVSSAITDDTGSPAKRRQSTRRASVRFSRRTDDADVGDGTMDLTKVVGGIQQASNDDDTHMSGDTSFGEVPMDFTMVMGGISKPLSQASAKKTHDDVNGENEDLTMEFTGIIGGIDPALTMQAPQGPPAAKSPATPKKRHAQSPASFTPSRRTPQPSEPVVLQAGIANSVTKSPSIKGSVTRLGSSVSRSEREASTTPTQAKQFPPSTHLSQHTPSKSPNTIFTPTRLLTRENDVAPPSTSRKSESTPVQKIKAKSPRRQTLTAPQRSSPRRASPAKTVQATTPKRASPLKKSVRIAEVQSPSPAKREVPAESTAEGDDSFQGSPVRLQDFLEMTNIRFIDLTTTSKRRHTAKPSDFEGKLLREDGVAEGDEIDAPSLESCVVTAACTVPMLELFRHSCHELKKYIAEGKDVVREIETTTFADNPPIFRDYMSAPPDEKNVMDAQFKNMKTHARLQSKAMWYDWRNTLLQDLKQGLSGIKRDFDKDDRTLRKAENVLASVVPALVGRHAVLEAEHRTLQERADDLAGCDQEELEEARRDIVETESKIAEREALLARLREQAREKDEAIAAAKERKAECVERIRVAESVREKNRGWSVGEVQMLKAKVDALEAKYGWLITSASSTQGSRRSAASTTSLTLTYKSDLQLFLHPTSFAPNDGTPAKDDDPAPISLTYIGDEPAHRPRALTTTRRFFLQLLRAHLHCITQSTTRLPDLLAQISHGWQTALAIEEAERRLRLVPAVTTTCILSDERMLVQADFLLTPTLKTKVRVGFEVAASLVSAPRSKEAGTATAVSVKAEVVYGQRYNEGKMKEFLETLCGREVKGEAGEMGVWADALGDLRERLIRRGKKD